MPRDPGKYDRAVDQRTHLTTSSLKSEPITVLVGKKSKAFNIDRSILRTSCTYFEDQAFTKKGKNVKPRQVKLPDTTVRAFEIYQAWLQTGGFYIMEEEEAPSSPSTNPTMANDRAVRSDKEDDAAESRLKKAHKAHAEEESAKWRECYMLGNAIKDNGFQDACIDLAQEKMISESGKIMDLVKCIYEAKSTWSERRKFVVDTAAHLWKGEAFEWVRCENYHRDFLEDMMKYVGPKMRKEILKRQFAAAFFRDAGCKYHDHNRRGDCYKETHPAYKSGEKGK